MDEEARKAIVELERRVAQLELSNENDEISPDLEWMNNRLEEIPQEIVGMLVKYLSTLDIEFSLPDLRAWIEEIKLGVLDRVLVKNPELKPLVEWEQMTTRMIIAKMLPD